MSIIKKKRIEENVEGGATSFSTPPSSHFVPNSKQRYRKIVYVPGIQKLIGTTTSQPNPQHSFRWDNFLELVRKQANKDVRELPGSVFGNPPMGIFLSAITPGIKVFLEFIFSLFLGRLGVKRFSDLTGEFSNFVVWMIF
ncbi:unnamed protein product [Meloidogyne enterolobii]|uniref:Uncharacterized protein n=1 Tax=Meloidogyne enterolobii TaxID=390850 RepID=A0ACB1AE69_MELEN